MPVRYLPSQPTSFIGRQEELTQIAELLADRDCRLLTIVGPGGMGKTRLALEAARQQEPHFKDGVIVIALAPVVSSDLLVTTIADRLGLVFIGQDTPQVQLCHYLQDKQVLVVLDNFEHLIEARILLSDLLQAAPALKLLVTSREWLHVQEEWTVVLEGLAYPKTHAPEALERFEAVRLFTQRARQVHSKFSVQDHVDAVVAICQQVEGMPLGLELAASWLRVMSCEQVAAQMGRDLNFLTTPLRNVTERHRSLQRVFEQSWQMMVAEEQAVLMRLSVFRGGFDMESAEYVAGATLSVLASLVDKSLVRVGENGRYDLHELLRQYAAEKLVQSGGEAAAVKQHLAYFIQLAEEAERHLFGNQQIVWFDLLEADMDNLRIALNRSAASEAGLHLAATLGWLFSERSHWLEGLGWFEQVLAANPNAPALLKAKALNFAGAYAGHFKKIQQLCDYCDEAIRLAQSIPDEWVVAWAQAHLGTFNNSFTELVSSTEKLEASVAIFRKLGDQMGLAHTLVRLSWSVIDRGDLLYARRLLNEAATITNAAGDGTMTAWIALTMGDIEYLSGEIGNALDFQKTSYSYFKQAKFPDGIHVSLLNLARSELRLGQLDQAHARLKDALKLNSISTCNVLRTANALAWLANVAKERGQFEQAAPLLGAASHEEIIQTAEFFPEGNPYLEDIAFVRKQIGADVFEKAWESGRAMTMEQVIRYVLEDDMPTPEQRHIPKVGSWQVQVDMKPLAEPLTPRELEILRLLVEGLNSSEIATRLFLSTGTVRWYRKIIYSKLDAHRRSEVVARAKALQLIV